MAHAIDIHSQTLIISYIELFLNDCTRFYDRQFITRGMMIKDLLIRFEKALDDCFISEKALESGISSVRYFAEMLYLSPNYFGDLIKKKLEKRHRSIFN